ncbi:MAG: hypothetical protein JST59_10530 [Actinobacteria bacterium]|nr:hypothetical protein [Actinomycetota bacterium]
MAEMTTDKRIDDLREDMREGFVRSDKRVDDLRSEMHRGFAQVDQRFDRVEADIRELRSEVRTGFDSLQRLMIEFFAGTLGSIVAGVVLLFVTHH